MTTKEAILVEAARLFARDGFEAVSARDVAQKLGLAQSSLYKHYPSKRAVFAAIVEKMRLADAERARRFGAPEGTLAETPNASRTVSFATVRRFSEAQFRYWTENEFAANFRKILTLEQFHDPEAATLYRQYFSVGPLDYLADVFWEAIKRGALRQDDPRALALEFYSPIYALYHLFDSARDVDERRRVAKSLSVALDRFERERVLNAER